MCAAIKRAIVRPDPRRRVADRADPAGLSISIVAEKARHPSIKSRAISMRAIVRLGYPIAEYAEGRIGVTVSGQGRGFDVDQRVDQRIRP